jgi:ketosteroid isomerase-like protein
MAGESAGGDLVERTRAILRAADRADFDAILPFYGPDAIWDTRGGGTFEGVDAIRGLWEEYYGIFDDLRIEVEEIVDFGDGVVLAVNRQKARVIASDAHMQARQAFIYEWCGGLVVRVTQFGDIDEARTTAEGLVEQRG